MIALIRRFWYIPAMVLLVVLFLLFRNCGNSNLGNYIAEMAKNKVISAELAKQKGISDYYIAENAKIDGKLSDIIMQADMNGAEAVAWHKKSLSAQAEIKKLKTCPEQLTATTGLLDNCNAYVLTLNKNYTTTIDDLNYMWGSKITLKNNEISEITALHSTLVATYGQTVKDLVIARQDARKRLELGFFAGYDPFRKQATVGFGFTFRIVRIKLPSFLGGIL